MLFSICIPVYNTSKYLEECLLSVLEQTETDYEIVLVDDGSTDNSGQICDSYADKHPNIRVIHKDNEGLLMTRRRGFREAKGDYVICVDSDDALFDADALKKIRWTIEEKQADLVIYEYIYGSEKGAVKTDKRVSLFTHSDGYVFQNETKQELYSKLLLGKGLNAIIIKAIARDLLDLDVNYAQWKQSLVNSLGEDLFQTLPILDRAQRIVYLKEPLYFYRWNPESISRNVKPEYYFSYRTVYQRAETYLQKWGFDEDQVHQIMQKQINMIFDVLLAEAHPDRKKWLEVLREVAEDSFFQRLWKNRDEKYVCKYYIFMGSLIMKKQFTILQIAKRIVEYLHRMKQGILNRRE